MKGKLITLYGINNIGKTTHAKRLVERLKANGCKSVYLKYPAYEVKPSGPILFEQLRGKKGQTLSEDELQMWFVMNRYQFQTKLKKFLNEGYVVVAEDYTGTGIVWGKTKGLDEEWLESINRFLVKEDFAIMLEGKRTIKAKEKFHVHEQNDSLMAKSEKVHQYFARKYGWHKVALQPTKDQTAELVWKAVDDFLR
ncbi:MAG: hypothetical protein WC873_00470 [Candidatus Gracilibacteria bacterium]